MKADPKERAAAFARAHGLDPHEDDWAPSKPQTQFLSLGCFEALYGGAAGGGKSDALLAAAAQGVGQGYGNGYLALLLRRTYPELKDSLIRRAYDVYPRLGGRYKPSEYEWVFPGGETIKFGHAEHEESIHRYQGSAFQFVGFDELASFTEYQYLYLFSRCRSAKGVPCRVRAASNPDRSWVRKRWLPWVSRRATDPAQPGEIRYYRRTNDVDVRVERSETGALGRTFVPAKLTDNIHLSVNDPGYGARLYSLGRLEKAQLADGDWDAEPAAKDYWDRSKIRVLREAPATHRRISSWDFAATDDPKADYYGRARCSLTDEGLFVIEHVFRRQGSPDDLHADFAAYSHLDGPIIQTIPEDPGAAGKLVVQDFHRRYPMVSIRSIRPSGSKSTRFMPVSSAARMGTVAIVDDGSWEVDSLHEELEALWSGDHDDRADMLSDAYAMLRSAPEDNDDALTVPNSR